jgi:hypothetical protein
MTAVIIHYNQEAEKLIEELKWSAYPLTTLRKLQLYTVNIYEREFEALNSKGAIEMIADTYAVLTNLNDYHPETGLLIPVELGGSAVFL